MSDPGASGHHDAGTISSDQAERLEKWKAAGRHRTHELRDGWHVLRANGVLLARNRDIGLALDTAEKRP